MKKIQFIFCILLVAITASCEEVIEVDLDTAPPRLVVDASINWVKGTEGNQQTIKLSTTTGYYNDVIPTVSGATVFVTNSEGAVFDFTEVTGTGNYNCDNFIPVIGESYTLTVIHEGQTYTANETLLGVPEISSIVQDDEGGFLGDNIEVRFFYQDDPLEDNFYMTRFDVDFLPYPDYNVSEDRLFQGNEMFSLFSDEDLEPGDIMDIKLYGISQRYYNYMQLLITISQGGGGGPFQSVPATVRGNLVNQTDIENYALGYFRLSEVSTAQYTVQ